LLDSTKVVLITRTELQFCCSHHCNKLWFCNNTCSSQICHSSSKCWGDKPTYTGNKTWRFSITDTIFV